MERLIEKYLIKKVQSELNGKCIKFVSPSMNGLPDRIILLPRGRVVFVETKSPGEKPRPLQCCCHRMLEKLGFEIRVMDTKEKVDKFISEIKDVDNIYFKFKKLFKT